MKTILDEVEYLIVNTEEPAQAAKEVDESATGGM